MATVARKNGIPQLGEEVGFSIDTLFDAPADWRSRSLCSELPVDEAEAMFFPKRGKSTKAAKALCAGCPVRPECLEFALADVDAFRFGVWGGTSSRDRRKLGRETAPADDDEGGTQAA
jgi:WhiB family redox-sensing transcriptional regulator